MVQCVGSSVAGRFAYGSEDEVVALPLVLLLYWCAPYATAEPTTRPATVPAVRREMVESIDAIMNKMKNVCMHIM
jgi:hypothetical protein